MSVYRTIGPLVYYDLAIMYLNTLDGYHTFTAICFFFFIIIIIIIIIIIQGPLGGRPWRRRQFGIWQGINGLDLKQPICERMYQ